MKIGTILNQMKTPIEKIEQKGIVGKNQFNGNFDIKTLKKKKKKAK